MDVFYDKLEPSGLVSGMDIVGGRLDYVSTSSINWSFLNSNQIRLFNPNTNRWELVKCSTEPTIANTALDMNGNALAVDKIYDVFAEYSSSTAFTLKCSRWASYGAGTSTRTSAYAAGTTYAIGDRVTYGDHDWVKQSTAAAGTTPVAGSNWVDNGTSVSGDFAGLYRHDGVLVSDSSDAGKSRRWLGIIYTYNNSGTVNFKDDKNFRYISNLYNTKPVVLAAESTTISWQYTTATWREINGGTGSVRGHCVLCLSQSTSIDGVASGYLNSDGGFFLAGCGVNSVSSPSAMFLLGGLSGGYRYWSGGFSATITIPIGYSWYALMEKSDGANANYVYGTDNAGTRSIVKIRG